MTFENITEIEWAQLATWLDSDGCIGIRKSNPDRRAVNPIYHPSVQVYNSASCVMEWLQDRFGGAVNPAKPPNPKHKQQYVWTCFVADHVTLLKGALLHFLVKRDRALLVIDYHEGMLWNGRERKGRSRATTMLPAEVARREALYQQSRKLNQLGPNNGSD